MEGSNTRIGAVVPVIHRGCDGHRFASGMTLLAGGDSGPRLHARANSFVAPLDGKIVLRAVARNLEKIVRRIWLCAAICIEKEHSLFESCVFVFHDIRPT